MICLYASSLKARFDLESLYVFLNLEFLKSAELGSGSVVYECLLSCYDVGAEEMDMTDRSR